MSRGKGQIYDLNQKQRLIGFDIFSNYIVLNIIKAKWKSADIFVVRLSMYL